jgi:hypothetical protein
MVGNVKERDESPGALARWMTSVPVYGMPFDQPRCAGIGWESGKKSIKKCSDKSHRF